LDLFANLVTLAFANESMNVLAAAANFRDRLKSVWGS